MPKHVNDKEIEKAILNVVRELNIENAAHMAPVYSLAQILELKNLEKLRKLGKILKVKYYSKQSKPVLVSALVQEMSQIENLRMILLAISRFEWDIFKEIVSKKILQSDKFYIASYDFMQTIGLLQSFYYQDKLWYVVPDEIKAAYKELKKLEFPAYKDLRELLNLYAIAAVSLYGVIDQQEFVDLFNSQNEQQIDIDMMFDLLISFIYHHEDTEYCFYDDYIVHASFEEDDFEGVQLLLNQRKGKPRYTPPKEEFIEYGFIDIYMDTLQAEALEKKLYELIDDEDKANDIFEEMVVSCRSGVRIGVLFDLLDSAGVVFDSMKQAQEMTDIIVGVMNSSRLWDNYGYTPSELGSQCGMGKVLPFSAPHAKKIGRNELCPCGSGKKHKNCCGKNTD